MQKKKQIVHQQTYQNFSPAGFVHRTRLKLIKKIFCKYLNKKTKSFADFGCSNGFIIEQFLQAAGCNFEKICGYDHNQKLLELAKEKNISNATFEKINLNEIANLDSQFDIVSCFETLEHVGNYKNALENIFNSTSAGGIIIISVPNEVFISGLLKFITRAVLRKNAYDDFFNNKSVLKYILALATNKYIDKFRIAGQDRYDPHLGFDWRVFKKDIEQIYIKTGRLELVEEKFSALKMNLILVYKKA